MVVDVWSGVGMHGGVWWAMAAGRACAALALEFSTAPMMGHTHVHHRVFWRLISEKSGWYSEMVPARSLCLGAVGSEEVDSDVVSLARTPVEDGSAVLQLGGCDVDDLREASRVAWSLGYRSINLNCGCPSSRVTDEEYASGAALMRDATLVGALLNAMQEGAPEATISVKHRLGVVDFGAFDPDEDAAHGHARAAVSYTHLTLPTILLV